MMSRRSKANAKRLLASLERKAEATRLSLLELNGQLYALELRSRKLSEQARMSETTLPDFQARYQQELQIQFNRTKSAALSEELVEKQGQRDAIIRDMRSLLAKTTALKLNSR